MNQNPETCDVKTCSCNQCRHNRGRLRKQIKRAARRHWQRQLHKIVSLSDPSEAESTFTNYGGGYTD